MTAMEDWSALLFNEPAGFIKMNKKIGPDIYHL